MIVHKRFFVISIITIITFSIWLVTFDKLLLGIWFSGLAILCWSFILARSSLNGISLKREAKISRLEVGKVFSERLEISNVSKNRKLWLEIEDCSAILGPIHSRSLVNLDPGKMYSYPAQIQVNRRGFYPLGPTRLRSGDLFGVFSTETLLPARSALTVYPHIERLAYFSLETGLDASGQNQLMQTARTTPQAAGVREYQHGDPLNRIHWPLSAKKDQWMVKEFDEDSQACAWLMLDAQAGIYPHDEQEAAPAIDRNLLPLKKKAQYQLPRDGFEFAVSLCASLADYFTCAKKSVALTASARQLINLPTEKGSRQLFKILGQLAAVEDCGKIPIQDLIQKQIRNIPRGSALVIISPRKLHELSASLVLARRWGLRAKVIQIDTESFENNAAISAAQRQTRQENQNLIRLRYGDKISSIFTGRPGGINARSRVSGGSLPRRNPPG